MLLGNTSQIEIDYMNVLKEQQKNNFGTKTILTNLRSRIQANNKNKKQTNQITSEIWSMGSV